MEGGPTATRPPSEEQPHRLQGGHGGRTGQNGADNKLIKLRVIYFLLFVKFSFE